MKPSKRIVFMVVACALVVAFMSIMSPKAVRAAIDLVRDADNPARHAVTAQCVSNSLGLCFISVPTDSTLVVDMIVLTGNYPTTNPTLELSVQSDMPGFPGSGITNASFTSAYLIPTFPSLGTPGTSDFFLTLNTSQFATNSTVSFHVQQPGPATAAPTFVVSIQGHLVSQP
jgi:hypothetical protein